MYELTTHESLGDIGEATWNRLAGQGAPPFLSWDFLDALEQTRCIDPRKGWMPLHVVLRRNGEPVAAMPGYVKGNSEGEFVFDHGWARFAEDRLGSAYYPKLIVAAPFTPATGQRLLCAPGEDEGALLRAASAGLSELMVRLRVSSVHVLFPTSREAEILSQSGMARRYGLQYHFRNESYASFEDFLSRFNSKRRNQIRRERREVEKQGIEVVALSGKDARSDVVDFVFECYRSTVDKYFWGRRYLNRDFFHEVCARLGDRVMIVLARDRSSSRPLGSAFNLVGPSALYGRYWGAVEERPFLHFNVCYYEGIDQCIQRGLDLFEPGAGGEHKLPRGFEPSITHSVHVMSDERLDLVVRDFVKREHHAIQAHLAEYHADPMLKQQ